MTFICHVERVKSPFVIHCVTAIFFMILVSKGSKLHSIYTVDSNTKSSNYMKIQLDSLGITINFELKLQIRDTSN